MMLALILAGCTAGPWREAERLDTVRVTWERVADTQAVCAKKLGGGMIWLGCSSYDWSQRVCHIFTLADAPEWVIGHEIKHCFGWTHD